MTKVVHEAVVSLIPSEVYARLSCQAIRGIAFSDGYVNGEALLQVVRRDKDAVLMMLALPALHQGPFDLSRFYSALRGRGNPDVQEVAEMLWPSFSREPVAKVRQALGYILDVHVTERIDFEVLRAVSVALTGYYQPLTGAYNYPDTERWLAQDRKRWTNGWEKPYGDWSPWWAQDFVKKNLLNDPVNRQLLAFDMKVWQSRSILAGLQQTYLLRSAEMELFDVDQWAALVNFFGELNASLDEAVVKGAAFVDALTSR